MTGRDQLLFCGRVDAIVAGTNDRWRADSQMDRFDPCPPQHTDKFAACGPADDGIIHQDNAFSFERMLNGVVFDTDAKIANRLGWLDESTANVMAADEADPIGDPGFLRITYGGDVG